MIHPSAETTVLPFGKFRGYTVAHVLTQSPSYAEWIINKKDFSAVWREAFSRAKKGEDISDLDLPQLKGKTSGGKESKKRVIKISKLDEFYAKIEMPYDKSLIHKFKTTVDGRIWDGDGKYWKFPLLQLPTVISNINGYDIKATKEISELYNAILEDKRVRREVRSKDDTDFEIEGMLLDLYPYQKVGVEFLHHTGGRAMIADEPGLGKTVQSIAYAQMESLKTLIVCPLSVVINWEKEIKKFTGKDACVWSSKGKEGHGNLQFHIINYDAVRKHHKKLRKVDYDLMICDEATYLKNRKTLRFKSLLGSWKERRKYPGIQTDHIVFLTGTPVMSRPIEAFTLLHILDKQRFNNFYHFTRRYGGWKGQPVKNLRELHERTKDLVIRRKKSDVLSELPDKQRNDLYIDLTKSERREYNELLDELFSEWRFSGKPTIGTMPKIQSYLIEKKIPRLREIIEEYLDNDRSILIFCSYIQPLKDLLEEYEHEAVILHGSMKREDRQDSIDALSRGDAKIGLFSLKAAGMGIDGLQHSIDTVVFLDRDWVPANHEQAEDRTHRIGQKNKVQIFYMTAANTIDEYMAEILEEKQSMASQIVDGEEVAFSSGKSIFNDFVKLLKRKQLFDV